MRQISASKRSQNLENRLLRFWAIISFHSITSVNISLLKKTQTITIKCMVNRNVKLQAKNSYYCQACNHIVPLF